MVYIFTKFLENILIGSTVIHRTWHNFNINYYIGHISVNIVHGVTVLVLCTSSNYAVMVYIRINFRKNIKRFQSYGADMIPILIFTKGHNSMNIVHKITVLGLFTTSNYGLHLYQAS